MDVACTRLLWPIRGAAESEKSHRARGRGGAEFSNDWKVFFQWLENSGRFSNDWKIFFQWLENFRA
jgi:hypothetical protein